MTWRHWGVEWGNAKWFRGIRQQWSQGTDGFRDLQGRLRSTGASVGGRPWDEAGVASRADCAPGAAAGNSALRSFWAQDFSLFPQDPARGPGLSPASLWFIHCSAITHWRYHLCRLTRGLLLAYHECLVLKIFTQNLVSCPTSRSVSVFLFSKHPM